METKSKLSAFQMGVGELVDVKRSLLNFVEDGSAEFSDIMNACDCLATLLFRPETNHIAKRIAVAVVNTDFLKRGWLLSVDDKGYVNHEFMTGDKIKEMFARVTFPSQL